jgi:hypothetical protein
VRCSHREKVLGIGVGGIDIGARDAHFGEAIYSVATSASASDDLDVGLQALEYPQELLVCGGVLLVGRAHVPTLCTSSGYGVAEE